VRSFHYEVPRQLGRCDKGRVSNANDRGTTEGERYAKITPFLWYDGKAEEAANFYTSIFKNSKVLNVARYGDAGPGPRGA